MKITTVTFRSNLEMLPFCHAHVEATAQVEPGESPQEALDELRRWVTRQLERYAGMRKRFEGDPGGY